MPSSYVTFCTDVEGTLYLGQSYQYNTPLVSFNGQTGLSPAWGDGSKDGSAAKAIQNAAFLFYNYGQITTAGATTSQRAALQLAIWAALYNTTAGGAVTGNRFSVSGADTAAIAEANGWLASLTGNYDYAGYLLYPSQTSGVNADGEPPQELLVAAADPEPDLPTATLPESPTVIAGALLLLPLSASIFRILRKKQTV
jgi:hypothetical protein